MSLDKKGLFDTLEQTTYALGVVATFPRRTDGVERLFTEKEFKELSREINAVIISARIAHDALDALDVLGFFGEKPASNLIEIDDPRPLGWGKR
jgi:hypothetical protein